MMCGGVYCIGYLVVVVGYSLVVSGVYIVMCGGVYCIGYLGWDTLRVLTAILHS